MNNIDFVISWVDNTDKKWQERKNKFSLKTDNYFNADVRYRDYGTLKYVFRSIEKYASWVHMIYLVTDHQVPSWLDLSNPKVKVIDHTDIIDKIYLPLFNSDAIEWNLDRIPHLAENFVYFNDDMLLNKKLSPIDFFKNNKPRDFRLYTDIIPVDSFQHIMLNNDILINSWLNNKWPISKKGLWSFRYKLKRLRNLLFLPQIKKSGVIGYIEPHGPLNFKKNSFELAKKIWSDQIKDMNTHRFRSEKDISIWLVRHLQLETGNFEPISNTVNLYCNIDELSKIKNGLQKSKSHTICINDIEVNNFNQINSKLQKMLKEKFPDKSAFEK